MCVCVSERPGVKTRQTTIYHWSVYLGWLRGLNKLTVAILSQKAASVCASVCEREIVRYRKMGGG